MARCAAGEFVWECSSDLWKRLRGLFPRGVEEESLRRNTQRIFYSLWVAIPLSLLQLLRLHMQWPGRPENRLWIWELLLANGSLLLGLAALLALALWVRKSASPWGMALLQYGATLLTMSGAVAVSAIDQRVTGGITPYLAVCILTGVLLLLRPDHALLLYIASYGAFYYAVKWLARSPEELLANRVNGLTVAGIGLLLAILHWHAGCVRLQQQQHIELQQRRLEQLAYYDPLTGLTNRRFFDELLERELPALCREGRESSLILLDLDDFKQINDTYGHPAGDSLLCQLARLLEDSIRKTDALSRLGGEEFIIFLPGTPLREAAGVAEKLRSRLNEHVFTVEGAGVRITASFGVSPLLCPDSRGPACNYSLADRALYAAKREGKNRVEVAGPAMTA